MRQQAFEAVEVLGSMKYLVIASSFDTEEYDANEFVKWISKFAQLEKFFILTSSGPSQDAVHKSYKNGLLEDDELDLYYGELADVREALTTYANAHPGKKIPSMEYWTRTRG